jgi:hypothetical protein
VSGGGAADAAIAAAAAAAYLIGGSVGAVGCRGAGEAKVGTAGVVLFSEVVLVGLCGVTLGSASLAVDFSFSLSVVLRTGVFLASKGLVGAGIGSSDNDRVGFTGVDFVGGGGWSSATLSKPLSLSKSSSVPPAAEFETPSCEAKSPTLSSSSSRCRSS